MYHLLDPHGDTVLELHCAKTGFAVWNDGDDYVRRSSTSASVYNPKQQSSDELPVKTKKSKKDKRKSRPVTVEANDTEMEASSSSLAANVDAAARDMVRSEGEGFLSQAKVQELRDAFASEDKSASLMTEDVVSFQVSSRHLVLASKYFERRLSQDWQEGHDLHSNGGAIIKLEEWDPDALLILLNIIHGQTRSVPRSLDLELLTKLAMLVDYFECLEVTEVFADMWISKLFSKPPPTYSRESILWILVCYVFKRTEELQSVVYTVVEQAQGPMRTLELPIPAFLVARIDQGREEAIARMKMFTDNLQSRLLSSEELCSFECSSLLLGALMKNIHQQKPFDPRTVRPFLGVSVTSLLEGVRQMKEPESSSSYGYGSYHNRRGCNLRSLFEPGVREIRTFLDAFRCND